MAGASQAGSPRHRFLPVRQSPLVAIGIQEEFDRQLTVLEKYPHISQENLYFDDVSDFKINGLTYVVVYKVFPERRVVEILAVLHERKNRENPKNYRF